MDGILTMDVEFENFIWDEAKALENIQKHEVDFYTAAEAFKARSEKSTAILDIAGMNKGFIVWAVSAGR